MMSSRAAPWWSITQDAATSSRVQRHRGALLKAPSPRLGGGDEAGHADADDGKDDKEERQAEPIEVVDPQRRRDLDFGGAGKGQRKQTEQCEGNAAPQQCPRRRRQRDTA